MSVVREQSRYCWRFFGPVDDCPICRKRAGEREREMEREREREGGRERERERGGGGGRRCLCRVWRDGAGFL
jgi:hypothetical protein